MKPKFSMFFKPFDLRGHRQCPHKPPSCYNTNVIIQICVLINHIYQFTHTHTHSRTRTHTHTHTHARTHACTRTHTHTIAYSIREWEWDLLARYVYTYKEFVIVREAPQCNRITVTGHRQQKNNIQISNVQNSKNTIQSQLYRPDICKCEMTNKYVWWINNV